MHCTCCRQWRIEIVRYELAPRDRGGTWLRLMWGRSVMGECRTMPELEVVIAAWPSAPTAGLL
jgi:hypothetical protein